MTPLQNQQFWCQDWACICYKCIIQFVEALFCKLTLLVTSFFCQSLFPNALKIFYSSKQRQLKPHLYPSTLSATEDQVLLIHLTNFLNNFYYFTKIGKIVGWAKTNKLI